MGSWVPATLASLERCRQKQARQGSRHAMATYCCFAQLNMVGGGTEFGKGVEG